MRRESSRSATSTRPARRPGSRSPTASRSGRDILRKLILLSLALAAAACGSPDTPEDEIRALVDAAEATAEERDASGLRDLIADDYSDASGRDAADVRNLLHAWLVAHPSVNLMTRIDSIELEGTELARVKVTVGMLGREASGEPDWDLAADIVRLDIRLARDGDDWRVITARQQDGG